MVDLTEFRSARAFLIAFLVTVLAVQGSPSASAEDRVSRTPPYDFGSSELAREGVLNQAAVGGVGGFGYCGPPPCPIFGTQRVGSQTGVYVRVDVPEGQTADVEVRVRFSAVMAETDLQPPRVCVAVPSVSPWYAIGCRSVLAGASDETFDVTVSDVPPGNHGVVVYPSGPTQYRAWVPTTIYGGGVVSVEEIAYRVRPNTSGS